MPHNVVVAVVIFHTSSLSHYFLSAFTLSQSNKGKNAKKKTNKTKMTLMRKKQNNVVVGQKLEQLAERH